VERDRTLKTIDAKGLHYKVLNGMIRESLTDGYQELRLLNVNGQRYIGDGVTFPQSVLEVYGTPGNDLGIFMNGLTIKVFGNAQDGVANTMNDGEIVIYGSAGDLAGYGMRGGRIFIRDSAGYRIGIHMKEYQDKIPVIVIGGGSGDFLGEYMAGGRIISLGLNTSEDEITGYFCGTGMHGGAIYIRGKIPEYKLGKETKMIDADENDLEFLKKYIMDFSNYFDLNFDCIMDRPFYKLIPYNRRPYGRLYAY